MMTFDGLNTNNDITNMSNLAVCSFFSIGGFNLSFILLKSFLLLSHSYNLDTIAFLAERENERRS